MKNPCNILLALMQLNIGGAETHVVELAKELARRGNTVIIASNGGVYTGELAQAGIKHYVVPLQNKNPLNMIKAWKTLRRIIKDEKIDIVHSHARIPSFILGKLHKIMKFPFVTTAHWVFTTKYGLKYITDWGEQTIAVSEDIKQYLISNYHVPENNIKVTINGIDTEKFSPETDTSILKQSLDIGENDRIIVCVSRLDEGRSLVPKQLAQIAAILCEKIENLKIIIVGDGNDFEITKQIAEKSNEAIGYPCVLLTGARTDINQFVSVGDLFVGVSRAALEAMSAQKPTIIAGDEGYIGLFEEKRLEQAINTNFCCRGCDSSTNEQLASDIISFFKLSSEQQQKLGVYGRELILSDYSVSKMTDDNVEVYNRVLK